MTEHNSDLAIDGPVSRDELGLPNEYAPPETNIQQRITTAFSTFLKVSPVGLDDDFYDLGGDSLQGEQISLAVEEILGQEFQISSLFYTGTPRKIAATAQTNESAAPVKTKPILFIVHGKRGYTMPRKEFLDGLDKFCSIEMFEMPGIRGNGVPPTSLQAIAKAYCDRIETLQPEGEIYLSAFCVGGLIALDMVRQLNERGRKLRGVVLVDPNVSTELRTVYENYQNATTLTTRLFARLFALGTTGRWSENKPFLQDFFRWVHMKRMLADEERFLKTTSRKSQYAAQKLNPKAQAWLFASYRYATFVPVNNPITIIASADRMTFLSDPKGFWKYVAPHSKATDVASTHRDVFQAESERTVAIIRQTLFSDAQVS
ncbi:Phosphopantetheine attachment site [Yoonia rosea]|uniref:Phosphopantetheine attachment site n=1 Tax=Yoonia rosea TaxID=287098 RepID=A0A1R3W9C4_9RHOB|nr:alpha/beta hydrolase [Yoonia rosea]SIT74348.1 Phosphopantetheine attachment site [Yoonia rosea]